ncbi:protein TAPT1 homolog [Rhipicephalus sanguineus]|uniref:protein TAPT1 homolog n=1 Tax=Rhipicephalus sanguineus TaxID=34632 RepID=UPI0018946336|nr:protein TAPT1 homolog [Rhipicephalus sanguineus]
MVDVAHAFSEDINAPQQPHQSGGDADVTADIQLEDVKPGPETRPSKNVPRKTNKRSLWSYLHGEVRRGYQLEEQRYEKRREKFYAFFRIPRALEIFVGYGFLQCADAFLSVLTLLPVRFTLAVGLFGARLVGRRRLQPAESCDLLKGLVLLGTWLLVSQVDMSMLYHIVKSQSVIKLYIFFNMLEVADKLFSSFGQDILDALLWTAAEPEQPRARRRLVLLAQLAVALAYVLLHCVLVMLQATTLSVAINSQNKALLTIMMSNNFVELKGMVFKKFAKNNLFQMACSDVRERFHYVVLLLMVIVQTMREYSWRQEQLLNLLGDCVKVLAAEVLVDWVKHAFVTRFNAISWQVYQEYLASLAYDLASSKLHTAPSDHGDLVSRRLGFTPLPLAALVLRVMACPPSSLRLAILAYLCLCSMKVLLNLVILGLACCIVKKHRQTLQEDSPVKQPRRPQSSE